MSAKFLSKLSQNYIELLRDDDYYDITIEVGEDPNVKIFRAHMNILCYRCSNLRRALVSNKKNKDNHVLSHIKLPNILPEVFQIILKYYLQTIKLNIHSNSIFKFKTLHRYIYGGILSLNGQDNSETFKILLAANELLLQELIDYLQTYLIENESEWMEQHFELIYRKSFQSSSLLQLQQFCIDLMANSPEKIFKSLDFISLPEKSLVQLIKRDDLQLKEIEVWEHVLKWGLAQNPTLSPDPSIWSDDDSEIMKNTLQHCLPLIRFFSLSSKEFLQKVHPYKKLLKHQFYEDLLSSHLNPDSKPTDNITLPRNIKIGGIIDSEIVKNLSIITTISRHIDKLDARNNFVHLKEPYKFELLLRGTRDGFTPKKFHELCNNIPHTVTFIKVKETEEILGGYNPIIWKSSASWGKTKDSFIFSFRNNNVKDAIISNIETTDYALYYYNRRSGPCFGKDIIIGSKNEYTDYNITYCKKIYYEKKIRDTEGTFLIEDYEVFQITKE